ncbi:hypothetical protein PVAND_000100 [Polypedilum vanderplanki]|uniref:Alpha-mannosidase n=1 Tax=Polypedilum vanderplanki TaxID=319348 RepID=A0A9J6BJQ1_POLVA|nr:hypothetical protein PVAND_000100 [Polypedilum vanderplanki]
MTSNEVKNDYEVRLVSKPESFKKFIPKIHKKLSTAKRKFDFSNLTCDIDTNFVPEPDNQMLNILNTLPFDDKDGGVWKQGFNISYDQSQWNSTNKLKVFIVMHSHNDPGWLYTFDEYYEKQTKNIFENMLKYLTKNEKLKLIWAEIVYFSKWFDSLDEISKEKVKMLIERKQLDFVTGGWVMPDEAASHWYSVLLALTEGQTWLKNVLNITNIKSSWAIDPFGHSSSFPYILKHAGFENLLIQRTHYSTKKYFAKRRELEFKWRQLWDLRGKTELFTHMMPFYSYDIPHTCGPDPSVCCQFDFRRNFCPWNIQPTDITELNIELKSSLLVDQWKKKSQLFKTNSLLTPLGDDFTYQSDWEWKKQTENFEKLINYINSNSEFNVEAKFATLQEYFDSVKNEMKIEQFPSLSGDFFTYCDRNTHYWSGYFTSRPFYKRTDRILMNYIRSAEMLYSFADFKETKDFDTKLEYARRALSIFQHHDGVSGTARDHVMIDYNKMMTRGIENSKYVIQQSIHKLMTDPISYVSDLNFKYFEFDDLQSADGNDEARILIVVDEYKKFIVIHNSQTYMRNEIIELIVNTDKSCVSDAEGNFIEAQISPIVKYSEKDVEFEKEIYKILFKVKIAPLGMSNYGIIKNENCTTTSLANVKIYSENSNFSYPGSIEFLPLLNSNVLKFGTNDILFDEKGLIQIIIKNSRNFQFSLNFMTYGTKSIKGQMSGAYIFMPDGPAQLLNIKEKPTVFVIEGKLESSLTTNLSCVNHNVILRSDTEAIEIRNSVDIQTLNNTEIVMRVKTQVKNYNIFYTDLNGLQYVKRKILSLVPLQGNYYPINSGLFIEDDEMRISLFISTPLGGSSLDSGEFEIMQDRKLDQDDERGLQQGVKDNRKVLNIFRILIENRKICEKLNEKYPMGFLTKAAYKEQKRLIHPLEKLIYTKEEWPGMKNYFGNNHEEHEDFEIVAMRKVPHVEPNAIGVVVHKTNFEKCEKNEENFLNLKRLLGLHSKNIFKSSITLLEKNDQVIEDEIAFCHMDTKGFILT